MTPTPIQHSIVINRPPADVFAFVTDSRNDVDWWKPVIRTDKITEGETGVGTEFIQYAKLMFLTVENHLKILEWNPPRLVRYRNESPQLAYDLLYEFEAVEGGTRFLLEATLEMKGVFRLLKPITMRVLHKQLKDYFVLLKQVMEAQAQS